MREEDGATAPARSDCCEEGVARFARGGFDRPFLFCSERADVCRPERKIDIVLGREFFNEVRISIARSPAQLMIEMTDDQLFVSKIDKGMQERDGVAPAGDAHEIKMTRWEIAEESFAIDQVSLRRHDSNVQCSTLNVQRSIGRARLCRADKIRRFDGSAERRPTEQEGRFDNE